jgi:hypothetical protein
MLLGRLKSEGSQFQTILSKKVCKTPFQWKKNWVWWYIPIIPAPTGSLK